MKSGFVASGAGGTAAARYLSPHTARPLVNLTVPIIIGFEMPRMGSVGCLLELWLDDFDVLECLPPPRQAEVDSLGSFQSRAVKEV